MNETTSRAFRTGSYATSLQHLRYVFYIPPQAKINST